MYIKKPRYKNFIVHKEILVFRLVFCVFGPKFYSVNPFREEGKICVPCHSARSRAGWSVGRGPAGCPPGRSRCPSAGHWPRPSPCRQLRRRIFQSQL